MSDYKLYGGAEMSPGQVDMDNDMLPIRDASVEGNAKHKKITLSSLAALMGEGGSLLIREDDRDANILDLVDKNVVFWYNNIDETLYSYGRVANSLFRSTLWDKIHTILTDNTIIFADSTELTADLF